VLSAFDRKTAKPGDMLCLRRFPMLTFRFKFMGHDGAIVVTWINPPEGRPNDAILRQRDVWMADKQ
jgi:hypothetical protein